jgi:tRNA(Phe) wybutosine-synthesizing methylase Tyw3
LPINNGININTINSVDRCIEIAAQLIMQKGLHEQACAFLGVKDTASSNLKLLNEYLNDLKLKVKIIQWDFEKKKIQASEQKLKDLRSEDLKTEEALSDISSALGL